MGLGGGTERICQHMEVVDGRVALSLTSSARLSPHKILWETLGDPKLLKDRKRLSKRVFTSVISQGYGKNAMTDPYRRFDLAIKINLAS